MPKTILEKTVERLNKWLERVRNKNEYHVAMGWDILDAIGDEKPPFNNIPEGIEVNNMWVINDAKHSDLLGTIDEIMRTLHYDNGKPLTTDEYSYFDHYDRDQDFWGFGVDCAIKEFIIMGNEIAVVVDLTKRKLRSILKNDYDGSSWEHDFG